MKKLALLISLFVLFSVANCATTKEAVKLVEGDFNLTGTWEQTEVIRGCGTSKTETSIVDITQNGDDVTAANRDKGWKWTHKVSNGIIMLPKSKKDKVTVYEYQLMVLEGADVLSAKVKWNYDNQCSGTSMVTYQRQ